MTAMPAPCHEPTTPDHPLTVAEYAALGETEPGYTELVEGRSLSGILRASTGMFTPKEPFPIMIELDRLR